MVSEKRFFVLVKGDLYFLKVFNRKLSILKCKSGTRIQHLLNFAVCSVCKRNFYPNVNNMEIREPLS